MSLAQANILFFFFTMTKQIGHFHHPHFIEEKSRLGEAKELIEDHTAS
jgi:hypothetical protein